MKKFIFFLLICFQSIGFSNVNWTKITKNQNKDTFYIDLNRVSKDKEFILFWVLIDSPPNALSNRSGIKSITFKIQCNCLSYAYKTEKTVFFSESMGRGKESYTSKFYATNFSSKGFWTFPSKNSSEEKVIKYLCKQKK